MSRRPTPTALLKLQGNPSHRPLNGNEPQPEVCAPEKPKGMVPAASREWDRMVALLLPLGLLTRADGKALMAYCDAYAMMEDARKDYRRFGLVLDAPVLDKEGAPIVIDGRALIVRKANPSVQIFNSAAKVMKSFLIEFGLTPASRSKLKLAPQADPEEEAAEQFLQGPKAAAAVEAAKNAAPLHFKTGKGSGVPDFSKIPAAVTDFEA